MTQNPTPANNVHDESQALEIARAIVQKRLGSLPRRVRRARGGLRNLVYEVDHAEGGFIVRLSENQGKLDAFSKERRVADRVRVDGIPAPCILDVGTEEHGYVYLLQTRAAGSEASKHPERARILFELGQHSARIHAIATHGFGVVFGWHGDDGPARTWHEYLGEELRLEHRLSVLEEQRMLSGRQIRRLREILHGSVSAPPRLNHGDLRLKNVIADAAGSIIAIIDWEDSISFVAPHWDFSVALHDLSIDEKEQFLAGYGASRELILECAPLMKALNIINYAPVVERQVRKQRTERIEQLRTRLSGALDLYSLHE